MNNFENLKTNPIFAMSLSSKELFHSNFWAWLFERNIEYAKIFFPNIKECKTVEREQQHRDITIWQYKEFNKNNNPIYDEAFVIENKFKSLPDKEQLIRYKDNMEHPKKKDGSLQLSKNGMPVQGKKFITGIVTGIVKPDFIDDEEVRCDWKFLSYGEIGKNIKEVAQNVEKEGFERRVIIEYAEMIITLYDVLLEGLKDSKNRLLSQEELKKYENMRIGDILQKLKASELVKFLEKIRDDIDIAESIDGYKLNIKSYFGTGGKAGVDIQYVKKGDKSLSVLGIQIEGNQYRWCIQKDIHLSSDDEWKQYYDEYKAKGWFVDYNTKLKPKMIIDHCTKEKHPTGLNKPYCVYGKKKGCSFIYQYWNIQEDNEYQQLLEMVKRDMILAQEILRKLKC